MWAWNMRKMLYIQLEIFVYMIFFIGSAHILKHYYVVFSLV